MLCGILAGIMWALETVILGKALTMAPFAASARGAFLAPFVSTFIHDAASALFLLCINGFCGRLKHIFSLCKTKTALILLLSSAMGGPVGMTGYVLAVNYMGASVGAVASAVYPAIGALLAYIFLKERLKWYQWIFLVCTLFGVWGLSCSPQPDIKNFGIGLVGALMCSFGWGTEGVLLSKCLKNGAVKSADALQLRQIISALYYGIIIIPLLKSAGFTVGLFTAENAPVLMTVACAAFFATVSYLFYYTAIARVGTAKAMGLNITYTAWAILFSVVFEHNYSMLNFKTAGCSALVVVCGIFAAADFRELFSKSKRR